MLRVVVIECTGSTARVTMLRSTVNIVVILLLLLILVVVVVVVLVIVVVVADVVDVVVAVVVSSPLINNFLMIKIFGMVIG